MSICWVPGGEFERAAFVCNDFRSSCTDDIKANKSMSLNIFISLRLVTLAVVEPEPIWCRLAPI